MNNSLILYLRNEENINEFRTPLIPNDIKKLIYYGFNVYVQSSKNRIYNDNEYIDCGAIITNLKWHNKLFNNALIIGLKEIEDIDKLSNHKHVYFSHSYKNQLNSDIILNEFYKSSSIIYDFEFFLNENNKRIIAFGFYAGISGCLLSLLQFYNKTNNLNDINNLKPWNSLQNIIDHIKLYNFNNIKIAIIGHNGRCGSGVKKILNLLNLKYSSFNKDISQSEILSLKEYDILFNCITLDKSYNIEWFNSKTNFNKNIIINDISCDYNKDNNPIKLYNNFTTWEEPIFKHNKFVDIIAINNLPSLLPKESSNEFSAIFYELLIDYNNDSKNYWKNNLQIFNDIIEKNENLKVSII